ncbi:DUF5331 domain-containing protein [Crocosphaera sp. XPORK-15E]|uniref:DUF5331 domain-containing protein n=1 Tax=Crocosphaera sp. XPORK-15E TaxID=3110247 RepID=UPI002B1E9FD2|nr:DUF5331 domain-containing protein [Crocosphaera sp. XPORK-15E]MEA5533840.1 DUF5331 domain-containing protein [Crocosphaera sp. XPORK-15E]
MITFEETKATLPNKWLDYYQINRSWIRSLMDSRSWWRKTTDDGKRPCADIILGAITALEPKLSIWMPPFCQLNSDGDKLIEVLGLHFDPEKELKKRAEERAKLPPVAPSEIDEIERIRQQLSKGEI